ncbi:MAG: Rieske (2Fe-2S) protein [Candidatus Acidiferrales bacterium]
MTERKLQRREFTKLIAIAGATAFTGAGCGETPDPVVVIAKSGEIPVGGSKVFAYPSNDKPCFLLHPEADKYIAFSRLCTHHMCPVFYVTENNEFDCPCHGGVFSATDGRVLAGPPSKPLPQIRLELRGTDILATGINRT